MDNTSQNGSNSGANNSSDFVRKLYKMLEDPSYSQIVRWGDDLDSFVVLENEKFTKSILPKHFKHSNFASFVRQLNKYDFHKVRHNNEENGASPYGAGAWEFKHPDFKANNKDALDNIRRKAPAPRKTTGPTEEAMPTQQMDLVNTQLVATQQQLRHLEERYNELSMHHSMMLHELISVQKTVVNHDQVMNHVMSFLQSVEAKHRRESRIQNPNPFGQAVDSNSTSAPESQLGQIEDLPASPLANAQRLLSEFNADAQLDYKNLERMNEMHNRTLSITTPPPDSTRNGHAAPPSAGSSTSMQYAKLNDLDNLVYPVGQNNGIDPMYSEHINNIPYPMPSKEAPPPAPPADPRQQFADNRKKSTQVDPGWVRAPQILLVEDDPTCRRIGSKFLYAFQCHIDSAFDGLEAVNKLNAGSKYDLVLMDIIMPNLDGVSACHLIRQFDHTPIIAMTSNIRADDISMYFQHGMNDVLPKPFTKEGLMNMLEKHLGHLKKPDFDMMPPSASTMAHNSIAHSLKDESSPGHSPSTMSNWHSPGQLSGMSPAASGGYMAQGGQYPMDASGLPQYVSPNASKPAGQRVASNPRRPVSDMTGPGDDMGNDPKRPRIYATTNNAMNQMRQGGGGPR